MRSELSEAALTKQGQTGPKLQIIRRAKNFQCRLALVAHHQPHIVTQAVPKNRVSQVTPGVDLLNERPNC